jgi:transcriptional repressor NrdR
MRCPYCQQDNDSVRDSRSVDEGRVIRRRRVCNHCHRRFTTYERVEASLLVVKKDSVREPFNRDKLEQGLERACWKRAISAEKIRELVAEIEQQVTEEYELEVPSRQIGNLVMKRLAEIDQVAYVRFDSVYHEFKDARDFVAELQPILDRNPAAGQPPPTSQPSPPTS